MGMLGVLVGLAPNTAFGFRREHAAVIIGAALAGGPFSVRQILRHIAPVAREPTGYGSAFLGMHLYAWSPLVALTTIAGPAAFLCSSATSRRGPCGAPPSRPRHLLFVTIPRLVNALATFVECGAGACCENGPCPWCSPVKSPTPGRGPGRRLGSLVGPLAPLREPRGET